MTDKQREQSERSSKQKGLSKEAWAAVSAIAVALIGGIVTIVTVLVPKLPPGQPSSSPAVSRTQTADAIAHKWTGEAKTSSGQIYTINVEIRQSCELGEKCGTIGVLQVPCYGEIYLKGVQNNDYEFDVRNFDSHSSTSCTPGPGEHFSPLADGRLAYRADWGIQGMLDKAQ